VRDSLPEKRSLDGVFVTDQRSYNYHLLRLIKWSSPEFGFSEARCEKLPTFAVGGGVSRWNMPPSFAIHVGDELLEKVVALFHRNYSTSRRRDAAGDQLTLCFDACRTNSLEGTGLQLSFLG